MVVVVLGQAVLRDLLQDDDERVDQVLEVTWSLLDLIEVVIETGCHDTGISVTQRPLHVHVELIDLLDLIKADEHHYSFFPYHLLGVLH